MNMETLVHQMDESFKALKAMHKTEEHCDQLMEMARGLMEKIEERDRTIERLRAEVMALKRGMPHA